VRSFGLEDQPVQPGAIRGSADHVARDTHRLWNGHSEDAESADTADTRTSGSLFSPAKEGKASLLYVCIYRDEIKGV